MADPDRPAQGRKVDQNAALGQARVVEPGPGPDQTAAPASAGGPGTGAGDAAQTPAESQRRGREPR